MTGPDQNVPDPAGPLDPADEQVLERIAAVHTRLDPPPADLDDRVRFAIALTDVDAEVARLAAVELAAARAPDRARTITFDSGSRTIMITIEEEPDGLLRIDGWLAPPAEATVELRRPAPATPTLVAADPTGRFVFPGIQPGLIQLLVHPAGESGARVVTPTVAL